MRALKWSGLALMAISLAHLLVLGGEALSRLAAWACGDLWTLTHLGAFREQPRPLLVDGAVFWSTVGSFAVPTLLLGALVVHMVRQGHRVPAFVGWGVLAWTGIGSWFLEPSGFPIGVLIGLGLVLGARGQGGRPMRPPST